MSVYVGVCVGVNDYQSWLFNRWRTFCFVNISQFVVVVVFIIIIAFIIFTTCTIGFRTWPGMHKLIPFFISQWVILEL